MTLFVVTKKSDGSEVYRYESTAPVEWDGFGFADHVHTDSEPTATLPVPYLAVDWYINVGPFFDRFGAYKIAILASTDPVVQAIIKDTSVRQYIDLKGRRAELAQALAVLQSKGWAVNSANVLDVQPNESEVHRG